jgi:lipid-binding SYLF domain-containing protein
MKFIVRTLALRIFRAGVILAALISPGWSQQADTADDVGKTDTKTTKPAKFDSKGAKAGPDAVKRLDTSATVLDEIMGTPDKGIPTKILGDAKCVIVIPSMVNIAVGFGGRHGKGVATCRTNTGWSAPAPITVTGGSWGLQLGGQAIDLVSW